MKEYQLSELNHWGFKQDESGIYLLRVDNVKIAWSQEGQCGAYVIDNDLTLIKDWNHLEDLIEQINI